MDAFAAVRRLRLTATLVVALALAASGVAKLVRPDPAVTMMSRYLETPRAQRAAGCLELALALWLASFRSPRLGPTVAAGTLAGMALLIAAELRRDHPLPSGSGVVPAVTRDRPAVRVELSVALAREAFLVALCVLAASLDASAGPAPASSKVPSRSVR